MCIYAQRYVCTNVTDKLCLFVSSDIFVFSQMKQISLQSMIMYSVWNMHSSCGSRLVNYQVERDTQLT